jgi:formylglycine-generating enzyme required for sulfatase activity
MLLVLLVLMVLVGCGDEFTEDKEEALKDLVKDEVVADAELEKEIVWDKDGAEMILIPASDITKPFYMDTTEVTVGQFKKFLAETDHPFDGDLWAKVYKYSSTEKHPMIYVDWHDATAYSKWAGKRLPTEEEWEFATRGGLKNKEYSWGDNVSLARDYANYKGTGGKDKWGYCAPVGSFKPNGYGLFDMSGNV